MRRSWLRLAAAGVSLVAAGLLASCTAAPARAPSGGLPTAARARPWWPQLVDPCAAPALVRAHGHVLGVGTCQGQLEIPALKVTLTVGQRIDVHMTGSGAVASGDQTAVADRLPRSSRSWVLRPGAIGPGRATQAYRAVHPGQAVLLDPALGCFIVHRRPALEAGGTCPVAVVIVVP
jgi:hypothetical protein